VKRLLLGLVFVASAALLRAQDAGEIVRFAVIGDTGTAATSSTRSLDRWLRTAQDFRSLSC